MQRRKRPGIGPKSLKNAKVEPPFGKIHVLNIGDLQFPSAGRLQFFYFTKNVGVVKIETGCNEVRFWILRFLLDGNNLVSLYLRDAKPLRVRNFLQEYHRSLKSHKILYALRKIVLINIIP